MRVFVGGNQEKKTMRRESRIINGLAASITAGVMAPAVVSGQTYYDGAPDYSVVGSVTDPSRDTTETVYDGIGTVTPLPGGTSVLERVLYQVEQLNVSSPGTIAPVNGIYANIAESVLQREWYTTDRLEQEFLPVTEYYNTVVEIPPETSTTDATWANVSAAYGSGTPTNADLLINPNDTNQTASLADVPIGTLTVYTFEIGTNTGQAVLHEDMIPGGQVDLTMADVGNLYEFGGYGVAITGAGELSLIITDAPGWNRNFNNGTVGAEVVAFFEFDGTVFRYDTLQSTEISTTGTYTVPTGNPYAGTYSVTTDVFGDDIVGGISETNLVDYSVVWEATGPALRSQSYINSNGLASSIADLRYVTVPGYAT